MLGMVDRHVLELLHTDVVSALELRFGSIDPAIRSYIAKRDNFDGLEWLVDRAEPEPTWTVSPRSQRH